MVASLPRALVPRLGTCALIGPDFSVSSLALILKHPTLLVMRATETLEIGGIGRVVFCRPTPDALCRLRGLEPARAWIVLCPETKKYREEILRQLGVQRCGRVEYLAI